MSYVSKQALNHYRVGPGTLLKESKIVLASIPFVATSRADKNDKNDKKNDKLQAGPKKQTINYT